MPEDVRDRLVHLIGGDVCSVCLADLSPGEVKRLADRLDQAALDKARVAELEAALGRVRALSASHRNRTAQRSLWPDDLDRALDGTEGGTP